mgnify:CR=1 FL=1
MLTKIKVYACYTVKIYTKTTEFFSNRGARTRRAGPGSAFAYSWEPMFVNCQNFATSWGRNFVGNCFCCITMQDNSLLCLTFVRT